MKINQNDRKRKFFGQISFEYEHNANYMLIFILISNMLILTHQCLRVYQFQGTRI